MPGQRRRLDATDWQRATDIRVERARLRLFQWQVAAAAGMHRTLYAHYEGGGRPMSEETYRRIVAALESLEPRWPPVVARPRCVRVKG